MAAPVPSADLGVEGASTGEIYAAMDWLTARQREIGRQLATRHLAAGGIAIFGLSSSWAEGAKCELAAFGHSAMASVAAVRSSTGCSPTRCAARSRSRSFLATSPIRVVQDCGHQGPGRFRHRAADHGRGPAAGFRTRVLRWPVLLAGAKSVSVAAASRLVKPPQSRQGLHTICTRSAPLLHTRVLRCWAMG
jgi:hypothetical protein